MSEAFYIQAIKRELREERLTNTKENFLKGLLDSLEAFPESMPISDTLNAGDIEEFAESLTSSAALTSLKCDSYQLGGTLTGDSCHVKMGFFEFLA